MEIGARSAMEKTSRCNKGQGFALLTVALKDLTETALYFKGRSLTGQDRSGAGGKPARSHDGCGERGNRSRCSAVAGL